MQGILTIIIHIITSVFTITISRQKENKQDRKLYIALMLGGFIWSQIQTEYLILRIKKNTEKTVHKL
ncbi:hypothetical protein CWS01_07165 [Niallia nealsonii]|uniref:Uncharacterized protein n=1 Tax=Niallia nealsonii TaxID=115979 RepID=A0A2N0Z4G6_9BACI|nr:hypothetical protein CWS01_07165 [Niallia nealsonii]